MARWGNRVKLANVEQRQASLHHFRRGAGRTADRHGRKWKYGAPAGRFGFL